MDKCEIRWCRSGEPATENTNEIIGDGSYRVSVCGACRELFGDELPMPGVVESAVKKRDRGPALQGEK